MSYLCVFFQLSCSEENFFILQTQVKNCFWKCAPQVFSPTMLVVLLMFLYTVHWSFRMGQFALFSIHPSIFLRKDHISFAKGKGTMCEDFKKLWTLEPNVGFCLLQTHHTARDNKYIQTEVTEVQYLLPFSSES